MNHFATYSFYNKGGRHFWISKYLKEYGYNPVVFSCNAKHGSKEKWESFDGKWCEKVSEETGVPYVLVDAPMYDRNGKDRIINMVAFFLNVKKAAKGYAKTYGKPDIIYASSVHPLTLVAGIQLAKKYNVKCVCEFRDLWPESIVASGLASKNNPLVIALYILEKWIIKKCDALITTFEGGYEYIVDKGYTGLLPKEKCYYINNGIDLDVFDENVQKYVYDDEDLDDADTFKVIYMGSLRFANGLEELLGCAKELMGKKEIVFLIYGNGDMEDYIKQYISQNGLCNVRFKGKIEKKYVPYTLSKGDVLMLNYNSVAASAFYRYGSSQNKLFEYLASGKPIVSNNVIGHDIILKYNCGISRNMEDEHAYAEALLSVYNSSDEEYERMCKNSRKAAYDFDFKNSTKELIRVFSETMSN